MELIVQACNLLNAIKLNQMGVNIIIVGNESFASRLPGNFSLEDIEKLITLKIRIRVYVNNLFSEFEIKSLEEYLISLSKIGVKDIVFHDYAVIQISKELKLDFNFFYHPETIVTSYGQFNFFKKNNIKGVVLSRELFFSELKEISKNNKEGIELEIQCHGLSFMMQSRWNLLGNYKDYLEDRNFEFDQKARLLIKEETRHIGNFIYEDRNGTHMFTGYDLYTLNIIDKINSIGIKFIRIDSAMKDENWILKISELYLKAIRSVNDYSEEIKNDLITEMKSYDKNIIYSNGFLGKAIDNPHVERAELANE